MHHFQFKKPSCSCYKNISLWLFRIGFNSLITLSFLCLCDLPGAGGEDVNCGWASCAACLSHVSPRPATRERQCLLWGPGLRHHPGPQTQTLATGGTSYVCVCLVCMWNNFSLSSQRVFNFQIIFYDVNNCFFTNCTIFNSRIGSLFFQECNFNYYFYLGYYANCTNAKFKTTEQWGI